MAWLGNKVSREEAHYEALQRELENLQQSLAVAQEESAALLRDRDEAVTGASMAGSACQEPLANASEFSPELF